MLLLVYTDRFPVSIAPTLRLLRGRVRMSRELVDDIVRARGYVERDTDDVAQLLEDVSFFDNVQHGLTTTRHLYSCNGALVKRCYFVNGKRHGIDRFWWWENGALCMENPFVNGERKGVARWWSPNGVVYHEENYE